MKLSILDQGPIPKGANAVQTLQQSVELAQLAEGLGFTRYWFAEHHGTKGLASSAPEIMIGHVAAHTSSIRVGSGGVLLPQYSSYKVAEIFRQLEALYPDRIDLGVGRSPGGTTKVRSALTDGVNKSLSEFPRQLRDLTYFLTNDIPSDHVFSGIRTSPQIETRPSLWVLGLGENSGELAGSMGAGYVFGHFINPERGMAAFSKYRESFVASELTAHPSELAAIFVVCADTDERAAELALSQDLWLLRVEKGLDSRIPSVEEAKSYTFSAKEKDKVVQNRKRMVIGSAEKVKEKLTGIAERYGIDEFMVLTNVYDFEERKQSYERLAELFL